MAAVVNRGGATPDPEPASREAAKQLAPSRDAAKLLEMFAAAQPTPDDFMPGVGMPGGADVPPPQGLYTRTLFGPGVWPSESENDMRSKAAALRQAATDHENASTTAKAQSDNVFSTMWTQGAGAAAAEEHYRTENTQHLRLIDAMRFIAGGIDRIADNVAAIKRNMRDANDIAHQEIEASFRANNINISPIQIKYRTLINENSASLHTIVAEETAMLSNEFPEAPNPWRWWQIKMARAMIRRTDGEAGRSGENPPVPRRATVIRSSSNGWKSDNWKTGCGKTDPALEVLARAPRTFRTSPRPEAIVTADAVVAFGAVDGRQFAAERRCQWRHGPVVWAAGWIVPGERCDRYERAGGIRRECRQSGCGAKPDGGACHVSGVGR